MEWRVINTDSEWERLADLERLIYPPDDLQTAEEYREWYREGSNLVYVLVAPNGDWIANFQIAPYPENALVPHETGMLYISGIGVFRPYQGKGYGHVVMRQLLALYGHCPLIARIHTDNKRSRNLLTRYGFVFRGIKIHYGEIWQWYYRAPKALQ